VDAKDWGVLPDPGLNYWHDLKLEANLTEVLGD